LWDGTVRCEVLVVEPPERLTVSWDGGGPSPETTVTWRLNAVEEGTRLRVSHEGLVGLRGLVMKLGLRGGWTSMYERTLPAVLDRIATGESPSQAGRCAESSSTA